MRVLLVTPVNRDTYQSIPDLGLGYLATSLRRHGHEVVILDCVQRGLDDDGLSAEIDRRRPEAIGFKVFYTEIDSVRHSTARIRAHHPQATLLIGGPHPSCLRPDEVFATFPHVDYAFQGEAEHGLPALLDALPDPDPGTLEDVAGLVWRDPEGRPRANPRTFTPQLDDLEPAWDLLHPRRYDFSLTFYGRHRRVAPILATRGCPHRCTFCAVHLCAGHQVRTRSVDGVVREMEQLRDEYGIREFSFVDDFFTGDPDFVKALCRELLERGLELDWTCWGLRLPSLDEEMVRLMDRAGCYYISVGIESGSPRILRHMRKGLTVDLVRRQLDLVRRVSDIRAGGMFILGYPEETEQDIAMTIELACELPLLLAGFYPFFPVPGTPIHRQLRASGELGEETDWSRYGGAEGFPFCPRSMSPQTLRRLYRQAYLRFYTRPDRLAAIARDIRDPRQLVFLATRFRYRILGSLVQRSGGDESGRRVPHATCQMDMGTL